jgi:hypothetical protein
MPGTSRHTPCAVRPLLHTPCAVRPLLHTACGVSRRCFRLRAYPRLPIAQKRLASARGTAAPQHGGRAAIFVRLLDQLPKRQTLREVAVPGTLQLACACSVMLFSRW